MATKEEFEKTLEVTFEGALAVWFIKEFNKLKNVNDSWLFLWLGILSNVNPTQMDSRNLGGSNFLLRFKAKIVLEKVLLNEPKNVNEAIELYRKIDFESDAFNSWEKHFGLN